MRRFIGVLGFVVGLLAATYAQAAATWTCSHTVSWAVASGYMVVGDCTVNNGTVTAGGDVPISGGFCGERTKTLVSISTDAAQVSNNQGAFAIAVDIPAGGKIMAFGYDGTTGALAPLTATTGQTLPPMVFHYLAFCR